MEKQFAQFLADNLGKKDDMLLFDAVEEFKDILKCNLQQLQKQLQQYNLKLVTNKTANEEEKVYFMPNMLRNSYLLIRI
jgi:hypothetical protein